MDARQAYQDKYEAQLRAWGAKIDEFQAKADKAKAEAKLEYLKQIEGLRAKQEAVRQEFDKLKAAGEAAWQDLRAGAERMWDDFRDAVESAAKRFQ